MPAYDRHIPYNSLPALPPSEEYYNDPKLVIKLTAASRKLAELKGLASMLPNQSIFINTISLREYVQGPAKEILHYREAIWKGYNDLMNDGKINLQSIINIYRQVKQTGDGIRPYQAEIVIKKRGWGSLVG